MTRLVKIPTRGHAILDLVWLNFPDIVYDVSITSPITNSDHNSIITFFIHIIVLINWSINIDISI